VATLPLSEFGVMKDYFLCPRDFGLFDAGFLKAQA
jgi:hypothetical protein